MKGEAEVNPMVAELDNTPDEAALATLLEIEPESIRLRLLESGEQKVFCYRDAKQGGNIKGSLTVGDTYSVYPGEASENLSVMINVSELEGRWFYDMEQHRGFEFGAQGGMSSINVEDLSFREWKLLNGKLYVYYLDLQMIAPERDEFLVEEAQIETLDKDNMVLRFRSNTYNCKRMREKLKLQ